MQKGIILFDIDKTIFNTVGMSRAFDERLISILGNPRLEEFKKAKEEYKSILSNERYFVPEDFIKVLCKKFNFNNHKILVNVFYGDNYAYIYKENVFTETFRILEKLRNRFRFGIFSEGTTKFQNHKFKSMNLEKYFDKNLIFIVDVKDTKDIVKKIPKFAIVVDDKESICEFLTKNRIKVIWLNKIDNRVNPNFETIHNLLDLNL